jgi:hypothetical protein
MITTMIQKPKITLKKTAHSLHTDADIRQLKLIFGAILGIREACRQVDSEIFPESEKLFRAAARNVIAAGAVFGAIAGAMTAVAFLPSLAFALAYWAATVLGV